MTAPSVIHGKTPAAWAAICHDKTRFADEVGARAMAQSMLQRHDDMKVSRLFVYQCPNCRGWHITKAYQPGQPAVTAADPYALRRGDHASGARTDGGGR